LTRHETQEKYNIRYKEGIRQHKEGIRQHKEGIRQHKTRNTRIRHKAGTKPKVRFLLLVLDRNRFGSVNIDKLIEFEYAR
jgi:hypothetical protein